MRDIRNKIVYNSLKKVMIHWGFGDMEASIYSLLVIEQKDMNAKYIAENIGYAYSSVVNALNQLRRHRMVERNKRGKCYSYSAVIDFVKILKNERRVVVSYLTDAKESLNPEKMEYRELWKQLDRGIKYLGKIEKEVD